MEDGEITSVSTTEFFEESENFDMGSSADYSGEERQVFSGDDEEVPRERCALPVADFGPSFGPGSVPTSGEEYLALVKHQRAQLAGFTSAESMPCEDRLCTSYEARPAHVSANADDAPDILKDFDALCTETQPDRECLQEIVLSVKEKDFDRAYLAMARLDRRLTSNQVSLLRSACIQSRDKRLVVALAFRFGQTDLIIK